MQHWEHPVVPFVLPSLSSSLFCLHFSSLLHTPQLFSVVLAVVPPRRLAVVRLFFGILFSVLWGPRFFDHFDHFCKRFWSLCFFIAFVVVMRHASCLLRCRGGVWCLPLPLSLKWSLWPFWPLSPLWPLWPFLLTFLVAGFFYRILCGHACCGVGVVFTTFT